MGMYRTFKILFIINIAVYILINKTIVSVKDAHAKISSSIWNSTKIKNVEMSGTVSVHNIKWTLRLNVTTGLQKIGIHSLTQEESTNKGVTEIIIIVDRAEERYMDQVSPDP